MCKIIRNRGHFPNDDAVVKLLWLAIRNIEDKRAKERDYWQPARGAGRLVEGQVVNGWKPALDAFAVAHPDRLASTSTDHSKSPPTQPKTRHSNRAPRAISGDMSQPSSKD